MVEVYGVKVITNCCVVKSLHLSQNLCLEIFLCPKVWRKDILECILEDNPQLFDPLALFINVRNLYLAILLRKCDFCLVGFVSLNLINVSCASDRSLLLLFLFEHHHQQSLVVLDSTYL